MKRQMLCSTALIFFMTATMPSLCQAQAQALSTEPPVVEYQYQLSYPRIWGWPGPGLSLGGSLPAKGREGISSFYGAPFPAPMGAGVYMNPFGYSSRLPGPFSFGLAQSTPTLPSPSAVPTGTDPSVLQAAANQLPAQAPAEPASIPNLVQSGRPIASSAEAIRRCREIELIGDAHFKDGNWNQAVVNYRNAVITAPDRAEAHYRLGISNAMLESFADAANELSRAVSIDPKLASTRHIIDEIFGSEKRSIPNTIVMNAATWANEDLQKPDRLLVLGVVLQCASDSRSDAILAAASRSYERQEQSAQQMALTVPPSPSFTPAASIPSFPR